MRNDSRPGGGSHYVGIGVRCVTCGSEARGDQPRDVVAFITHHTGGECREPNPRRTRVRNLFRSRRRELLVPFVALEDDTTCTCSPVTRRHA